MPTATARTDALNIALMLPAAALAMVLPFHLFLFVYAFLGPLHYLTEINWLHKRGYFTSHKRDYLFIVAIIAVIAVITFTGRAFRSYVPVLTFVAFGASLGFVAFTKKEKKILFALAVAAAGLLLSLLFRLHFSLLFAALVPTIVHVFVFTAAFMLVGAVRSKSAWGVAALVVFAVCSLLLLFAPLDAFVPATQDVTANYRGFRRMNKVLIALLGGSNSILPADTIGLAPQDLAVYFSATGTKVMRFIAFAYTYHYLNWFSKTSVIQWHNTRRINLIIIALLWTASVALYLYDYRTGLRWLYLLSFGHVLLEFPLNHRSFIDLKNHLALKLKKAP